MTYDETLIYTYDSSEPVLTIGHCRHDEHVIPVESVIDGEVVTVARLCLDCDKQLEVDPASVWEDR